ncbi:MAG: hypothetical protein EXQ82_01090 [Pseudolabrys sp.]|nr:hypothetical protein [Pseudolabrys sp.]
MSKRKDIEDTSGEPPKFESAKIELAKSELPTVESPSISPATPEPKVEPIIESAAAAAPASEVAPASAPSRSRPRFVLQPRQKRYALLAASVVIAAALGAVVGAVTSGGLSTTSPRTDVAGLEERQSMQQSIARLAKEVTTLKTSLEATNKSAHQQIAKITERFDRNASAELVTGSISAPQTVTPVPTPRPAPHVAAVEAQSPARPRVVQDWAIRDTRDGFVYVQGHGDVYQVVPGAPLPGLGQVESVKRQDGRWVVTTPKGIIVSMRDRHYFE